jgi:hypothetical protein
MQEKIKAEVNDIENRNPIENINETKGLSLKR